MKNIYHIIVFSLISFSCYTQSKLIGDWTISNEKKLSIFEDESFKLYKGNFTHEGKWEFVKVKKENDQLILRFKEKDIAYIVEKIERNSVQLYDQSKGQIIVLKRMEKSKKEVPAKKEILHEMNSAEPVVVNQISASQFDSFNKGRFVINPGYGLINYIDSLPVNLSDKIPSLSLLLEKSLGARIGVGVKLGYRQWENQESVMAALYSSSVRLTYHPKVLDNLDTYLGAGATLRFATIGMGDLLSPKWSVDYTPVVGARYYLAKRFALTGEFAFDTSSNITLGFAILLH